MLFPRSPPTICPSSRPAARAGRSPRCDSPFALASCFRHSSWQQRAFSVWSPPFSPTATRGRSRSSLRHPSTTDHPQQMPGSGREDHPGASRYRRPIVAGRSSKTCLPRTYSRAGLSRSLGTSSVPGGERGHDHGLAGRSQPLAGTPSVPSDERGTVRGSLAGPQPLLGTSSVPSGERGNEHGPARGPQPLLGMPSVPSDERGHEHGRTRPQGISRYAHAQRVELLSNIAQIGRGESRWIENRYYVSVRRPRCSA